MKNSLGKIIIIALGLFFFKVLVIDQILKKSHHEDGARAPGSIPSIQR